MFYNIKIEFRRYWNEICNFKINMICANLGLITLFSGLLDIIDIENGEIVFILMFIWYSATHGFMNINFIIEEEIIDGTLPHIICTKVSFLKVITLRSIIQIIYDLLKSCIVFSIVFYMINFKFHSFTQFDWLIILICSLFSIIISYFIGLVLGSLALKYKKITALPGLFYYYIFFFGGVMQDTVNYFVMNVISYCFPFMPMRKLLYSFQLGFINYSYIGILLLQGIIYFTIGVYLYNKFMKQNFKSGGLYYV